MNPKRVPRGLGKTPSQRVQSLYEVLLGVASWKTAGFKKCPENVRSEVTSLFENGHVKGNLEFQCILCIQLGVELSDELLNTVIFKFNNVNASKPFPATLRKTLFKHIAELQLIRFKLWADETVIVNDFDEMLVTGPYAPESVHWSETRTKAEWARTFGINSRKLIPELTKRRIRFEVVGRQSIRIAADDIPDKK